MPCKHLKTGWRWKNGRIYDNLVGTKIGKEPTTRPCGQCIDCRLDKSREWAIRCKKEAELHNENCVVTLTYSDKHLPANGSIDPEAGSEFMKRLRSHLDYRKIPHKIKTYGCAEYGCNNPRCGQPRCQHNMRPHYHIILFNFDFPDKKFYANKNGTDLYTSDILEQTWGQGGCKIMDCNFKTAAYVARYVMKKLSGPGRYEHEQKQIKRGLQKHYYGEKLPEQSICIAQQSGIAKEWYDQNKHKIYANDILHINGKQIKPVKYFDNKYEIEHPNEYKKIKQQRQNEMKIHLAKRQQEIKDGNHTNNFQRMDRQIAHEKCMEAKIVALKRTLE